MTRPKRLAVLVLLTCLPIVGIAAFASAEPDRDGISAERVDRLAQRRRRRRGQQQQEEAPAADADGGVPPAEGEAVPAEGEAEGGAPEQEPAHTTGVSLRRSNHMEFDARLVRGETAGSGAVILFERAPRRLPPLTKQRTSFLAATLDPILSERVEEPQTAVVEADAGAPVVETAPAAETEDAGTTRRSRRRRDRERER